MLVTRLRDVTTIVANALSLCATDTTRVGSYVNRACERLLYVGKFKGTYGRYQVCVSNGCFTWPRQIETIETVAVCGVPFRPRNQWFEYLESGPGVQPGNATTICSGRNLIDKGEACAFDDIVGTGKKIAVYSDATEAATATITLQYYDSNNDWVTTTVGGQVIDGERITLPAAGGYAYTANEVLPGGLVRVYRDVTKGRTRLFEYDVATAALKPIAIYERDEVVPVYRRSYIPNLSGTCCGTNQTVEPTTAKTVEVIGKIRFIPVTDLDDFLCISYPEAIRLGAQAVLKEENSKMQEAAEFWAMANMILGQQLAHHLGDGAQAPIALTHNQLPNVLNLV